MNSSIGIAKKSTLEILIVLGISSTIPFLFHLLSINGSVFLPIYLAILVGSHFIPFRSILVVTLLTPIMNYFSTGMPMISPVPMLQILTVELLFLVLSLRILQKKKMNLFLKLSFSVLIARLSSFFFIYLSSKISLDWFINTRLISYPGIFFNIVIAYIFIGLFYEKK